MTADEQTTEWVKGNSIHNDNPPPISIVDDNGNVIKTINPKGGECCPDFSCCRPSMKWPPEMRQKFASSNRDDQMSMLGMAMTGLLIKEKIDPNVLLEI
jgi:hypothetical protein